MYFTSCLTRATASTTSRLLAVLALLCVLGTQVVETAHQHPLDETSAHCLLCKNPAPAALSSAGPLLASIALAAVIALARTSATLIAWYQPRQSRGPPVYC